MGDDLSLLFKLRGDNAQLKSTIAESRAAAAQLRQSFGPQLTQTLTVASKSFANFDEHLTEFIAEHVPLVGGAFAKISEGLKSLEHSAPKSEKAIAGVAKSIESIASQSGKTVPQVTSFLKTFTQIEGQAKRNDAAFRFFGGSVDLIGNKTAKFVPEIEEASASLAEVSAESAGAGASIASMAGPIGIAVLAIGALVAGTALAAEELFEISKRAAEFQGRMVDLAQQTGLAVETLSALEVAAKLTGGEIGSITQAVFLFQRKLDDAQDPLSKTAEQFRKFKIDTSDTENALRQAFTALAAMPEGFAQTNAAAEFFGARGGKQVLAILKETNGDLDKTIEEMRELGILISEDDARSAKKFNDSLILLNFQLRALGAVAAEDLIPAFAEIVRSFGELVHAARPLISLFGTIAGFVTRQVAQSFKSLSLVVQFLTRDYEGLARAMKEAKEASNIGPISVPNVAPIPLPGQQSPQQSASEAVNQAEEILAAVKRNAAQTNQALSELFQKGRRDREQETTGIIAENKKVLEAEQGRLDALISQKQQEIKALDEAQRNRGEIVNRDTEQYRTVTAQLVKLFQERQEKENEFDVTSKALRAKAAKERADATRNQIANERDILVGEFDRTIKEIEAKIKRGATSEEDGLIVIEQLEQAKIDARLEGLQKQRDVGFLTIQDQKDLDAELQKLQQEKDQLEDDQRARRLQREHDAGVRTREIAIANIDALIQLEQSAGQRRIDTLQALADRRVVTEEEAAKEILKIRLSLIDDEIEATQTKLKAAGSIADKNERIRTEADLNNQIKILKDQRVTIETEGNRAIDDARQKDTENERRYVEAIISLRQRLADAQRDIARTVIDLMVLHFASRRDIIKAQAQLEIDEESRRNKQAENEIRSLRRDVVESNRTREEKLAAQLEIDDLEEAEAERHRLRLEEIRERARLDKKNAEPLGRLSLDLDNLKEFARVLEDSIVPLGQILTNTFHQFADAIGQAVSNWVLLGETGPAVMRKILAQALASVAAEAAVNAIKELALGFATLFFNPAESAAHFTSAALWGSIAGVAAIAGRGVAGDLFKSKGTGAGGGNGSSGSGQLNPLTLNRNQPQVQVVEHRHVVEVRSSDSHILKVVTTNGRKAGEFREFLLNDA